MYDTASSIDAEAGASRLMEIPCMMCRQHAHAQRDSKHSNTRMRSTRQHAHAQCSTSSQDMTSLHVPQKNEAVSKKCRYVSSLWRPLLRTQWSRSPWCVVLLCVMVTAILSREVSAFNVDTRTARVFAGDSGSMFGFTVMQYRDKDKNWVLVGAPRAQTDQERVDRAGAVYRCPVSDHSNQCTQMHFDKSGNDVRWNGRELAQFDNKTDQWLGASLHARPAHGKIVTCAPRYRYFSSHGDRKEPVGMCYVADTSSPKPVIKKYSPCKRNVDKSKMNTYGGGQSACQTGMDVVINTNTRAVPRTGAHIGSDTAKAGDYMLIGAVGSYYWQGQIFSQNLKHKDDFYETRERSAEFDNAYMGYSTAVGDFNGDNIEDFIVGAPKGNNFTGRVDVYQANRMEYMFNIPGEQLGEYFGFSLTVGDFNGDNLTDVAVGAPFYTDYSSDSYESGRVQVYYQSKQGGVADTPTTLTGRQQYPARFGLALTSLGDINDDGYTDLAVGAPYGGPKALGAVYIFHGSAGGVLLAVSQIVEAADVGGHLGAFGYSLSAGQDQDGNKYPDLLVGAYTTDNAVLLRSRPVIRVTTEVILTPHIVDLDHRMCKLDTGLSVTCFTVTTCMTYDGTSVPQNIDLTLEWGLDLKFPNAPRAYYLLGPPGGTTHQDQLHLTRGGRQCKEQQVYIRDTIDDKRSPIDIQLRYSLVERANPPVNVLTPLLDQYIPTTINTQANILKNCGGDSICTPDLRVIMASSEAVHVMGSQAELGVIVHVGNYGEDAHRAHAYVSLPPGTEFIGVTDVMAKSDVTCESISNSSAEVTSLICLLGNPVSPNEEVRFTVRTLADQITDSTHYLLYNVFVNSTDPENLTDSADNRAQLQVGVTARIDLKVTGVSQPEQVFYNSTRYNDMLAINTESDIGPPLVHLYEVLNLGPSPAYSILTVIHWPSTLDDDQHLLYLTQPPVVIQGRGSCTTDWANIYNVTVEERESDTETVGNRRRRSAGARDRQAERRHPPAARAYHPATPDEELQLDPLLPMNRSPDPGRPMDRSLDPDRPMDRSLDPGRPMDRSQEPGRPVRALHDYNDLLLTVSCRGGEPGCRTIVCETFGQAQGESALIEVRSRVWVGTIIRMQNEYRGLRVRSQAVAQVMEAPHGVKPEHYHIATHEVETFVAALFTGPGERKVAVWVIAVSIVAGSILLLLLVFLLWLAGFFERRRTPEDKEELCAKNGGQSTPTSNGSQPTNGSARRSRYATVPNDEF